ncbi:MAG: alpha/beta fold hydrolase [Anaerolineales bacterium]|nr:alpha/beta fold hydrolase [Anaerolineales bacterium]
MKLQIHQISLAYDDAGHGTPVLFIHGYPLNRHIWQPQLEGLSGIARIIAPDLRGHGESQATSGEYSMELLADDCAALLDSLSITQKVILCGLSMGGYVTFAFLRKYASRLGGLILTATRAAADSEAAKANRNNVLVQAQTEGAEKIVEDMLPKMFSPQTLSTNPALVDKVRRIMQSTSLDGIQGDLMGMKNRPDSTPLLSQINIPTLLVFGAEDQIIPVDEAQAMHSSIAGSRLEIIASAGHLLNLEQPQKFNIILDRFLRENF